MGTNNVSRISFGIIGNNIEPEIIPSDTTVEDWIADKEFTDKQYKSLIIGFIEKGKLQLYMAATLKGTLEANKSVSFGQYNRISKIYREYFGCGIVEVFDGVKIDTVTNKMTAASKILELNVVG